MSQQVLIISTSPRKGGNSELLADEFGKGALVAGHSVEKVCLYDQRIGFCQGCLSCQETGQCIFQDDAERIVQKMRTAKVLVFATPIYFYGMSGQMKTLLDRSNPLFPSAYAFRDVYLLAAAADGERAAIDGAVNGLQGWLDCFENATLKGVVRGVDATEVGDIHRHPAILTEAFQLGKSV